MGWPLIVTTFFVCYYRHIRHLNRHVTLKHIVNNIMLCLCDYTCYNTVYHYILGGLETEKDYPYEGEDDKCVFKKGEAKVDITGALNISSNEEGMICNACVCL